MFVIQGTQSCNYRRMASVLLGMVQQAPVHGSQPQSYRIEFLRAMCITDGLARPSRSSIQQEKISHLRSRSQSPCLNPSSRGLLLVSFDGGPWILRWAPDSKLTLPFSLWISLLLNSFICDCFMILPLSIFFYVSKLFASTTFKNVGTGSRYHYDFHEPQSTAY